MSAVVPARVRAHERARARARALAHALTRRIGRRLDVAEPEPRAAPGGGVRFALHAPLRAGWYMLEVAPGAGCIGAGLTLEADGAPLARLLLSPKPLSKRVVRLAVPVRALSVGIERDGATLRRVTLAPLTTRFALSRMLARLRYGGSSELRRERARRRRDAFAEATGKDRRRRLAALYADYAAHLERHAHPIDYAAWRARYAVNGGAPVPLSGAHRPRRPFGRDGWRVEIALTGRGEDGEAGRDPERDAALDALLAAGREAGLELSRFVPSRAASSERHVLFLDVGTRPEPTLATRLAAALSATTVLCYADHDERAADGARLAPAFKPDWNPDLLLEHDYIGDAFLCRSDRAGCLEAAAGGTRAARRRLLIEAALDLDDEAVAHVPEILSSVAAAASGPADRVAPVRAALGARNRDAEVLPGPFPGTARLRWARAVPPPSVEIVVPTRDRLDVLRTCVSSVLRATRYPDFRVTIADNDSAERATHAWYRTLGEEPRVRVLACPGPFNYSAINNRAVAASEADIVVLLNNDTEVLHADWLDELVRQASRPQIGCVGAKLYYSNDLIQHAGVIVGMTGVAGHAHRFLPREADGYGGRLKLVQNVTAVTGACLALRRSLYDALGGLDAEALPVSYNDVDLCLRARAAGFRNLWTPAVELYHHESLSRGADDTPAKRARARREFETMRARWNLDAFDDPAYNPNLTLDHEDFGLAA